MEAATPDRATRTTCPYCGVGCGVLAETQPDGTAVVRGDPGHPANFGRLCSKGTALAETLDLEGRLLHPEIRGRRASWETALDTVAHGFARVLRDHGPQAVAFYVSGQLLTEDYYVANKLMKGFLGSANIDTNSRLCMASSVAGQVRAFGADTVPGNYEDLDEAELVVLVGSNTAWCHPVLYQRLTGAGRGRPQRRIVVIDPRRTATCDAADLHLALAPGSDAHLFNGLLCYLHDHGAQSAEFTAAHTRGLAEALGAARAAGASITAVAAACGLDAAAVERFYRWFARTDKVVTVYSQGINQSSSGTDKVNAIINCHLLTGRIGRPGMGPFSITGQPNAMGGREVGALANQLAAHMGFDELARERIARFWKTTRLATRPGLKAVELFRAVERGEIKALWIMATNPAVSLPDAGQVRRALARCELLVVSDCVRHTDTSAHAQVLLPALAWGEKDGTVTNSERRISRQRAFLPPPGEARADWWTLSQVAQRLGHGAAFDYGGPADIFREHAALTAFENDGSRDLDLGGLATLTDAQYAGLAPVQWPVAGDARQGTARLFGAGGFHTPDRRARFVAVTPRAPAHATDPDYPLALNTGRVRDHWHTLTRTGKSARLSQHSPEPYVEIHPDDARTRGLEDRHLARLDSRWGFMLARVRIDAGQRLGSVFAPMHWNDQFARNGCVGVLVNPATDPVSGQPESKHTPVAVRPYRPAWHGFVLSRRLLAFPEADYAVSVRGQAFWRFELAGDGAPDSWKQWARSVFCTPLNGQRAEWIDYLDAGAGSYRGARLVGDRLESCVFIAPAPNLPARAWLAQLFERPAVGADERRALLSGRAPDQRADLGGLVCACFGVTAHTIRETIRREALDSVEAVGRCLKAGTNCGSCQPEIAALIRVERSSDAA
ncbi:MAG TPA: molybdopterin-dependent oxidoreductase [Acidiferrobacterales bacterium]